MIHRHHSDLGPCTHVGFCAILPFWLTFFIVIVVVSSYFMLLVVVQYTTTYMNAIQWQIIHRK